jgi:phosphatidylinositol 4-kinase B
MPMWCSSSDSPKLHGRIPQPHHRIVRIPPGESVVLNSAERAPYLLLIEILNEDLDFDPKKRSNKEVLKKIAMKEQERKGASRDLVPFNILPTARHGTNSSSVHDSDVARMIPVTPAVVIPPAPTSASTFPPEDEEIDLVEQLYGSDQSLRTRPIDLSDSIVLPPAPKNRELDMAAWSRSSSVPSTPLMDDIPSSSRLPSTLPMSAVTNHSINGNSPQSVSQTHESLPDDREQNRILSLDEYSERMRTAAIMLAQLNASLARESASQNGQPNNRPTSSLQASSSWMLASSWLNSTEQPSGKEPALPDNSQQVSGRLKLQHAEASAIRDRIMTEMLALEEERMARMREHSEVDGTMNIGDVSNSLKSAEDENIIRRELNKADPSAVVFSESWAAKKVLTTHWLLCC